MDTSLIDKNLYYKDLLLIDSKALVDRYNDALIELGIAPTNLKSFYIDALGWSPEIAKEKDNLYYLGAGLPNPMAIILTPNQLSKPSFMSFNSYDKQAIDIFAQSFNQEIVDITTTHAICVDIDDSLIDYSSPLDLLLINYIVLRSELPGLTKYANEQHELVEKFLQKPFGWMNKNVRAKIIESAKKYGDMRYRRTYIQPLRLTIPNFFYTQAFDGVYVMTNQKTYEKFLVLKEDKEELKKYVNNANIFLLGDNNFLNVLKKANIADFNQRYWETNLNELNDIIEFQKMRQLSEEMPELDLESISKPKLKSLLKKIKIDENIIILERIFKEIENKQEVEFNMLNQKIKWTLTLPNEKLHLYDKIIIRQALCKNSLIEPSTLYNINSALFLSEYNKWNQNLKSYVTNCILRS